MHDVSSRQSSFVNSIFTYGVSLQARTGEILANPATLERRRAGEEKISKDCLVFVGSLNREAPYFQGARGVGLSVYSFEEATLEIRKLADANDVDPTVSSMAPSVATTASSSWRSTSRPARSASSAMSLAAVQHRAIWRIVLRQPECRPHLDLRARPG
ncbi:hypothetical protein [Mesorhizobium sp. NZP2077]|uniref:hypothetical protein n=1 Tax=Mesorhizobium sp. NZP2077 TaxID=2483404 RepID=UPI0032B10222